MNEAESLATVSPTLGEMNFLAQKLAELKDSKAQIESQLSEVTGEIESINKRVIDLMMENELTSYKAPQGTMSVTHHFTARLPQGEDKIKLWEHLKSLGLFDSMASIHSQTFNSWVKEQYDLAKEQGKDEPKIPGVTDVGTLLRISFRRVK